jgi:hypothetical protein
MSRREFIKELISHQHWEGLATPTLRVNPTVNRLVACGKKPVRFTGKTAGSPELQYFRYGFWVGTGPVPPETSRTGPVPTVFVNPAHTRGVQEVPVDSVCLSSGWCW